MGNMAPGVTGRGLPQPCAWPWEFHHDVPFGLASSVRGTPLQLHTVPQGDELVLGAPIPDPVAFPLPPLFPFALPFWVAHWVLLLQTSSGSVWPGIPVT